MKDNNVKSHDENFTQGNAISLLLSRINKAKVSEYGNTSPVKAKKVVSMVQCRLAVPEGRRLTHQGMKLARGAQFTTTPALSCSWTTLL